MDWSSQRKVIYGISFGTIVMAICIYVFRDTLFPAPTCFDKKQNGFEVGVDCGGTCSMRCSSEVSPISVEWSRFLKTSTNKYDFVGMAANKNIDNAPRSVDYAFTAYDNRGVVLTVASGTTIVPVDGEFPIIAQNITIAKEPKEVILEVTDGPHFIVNELPTSPAVRILNSRYEPGNIPHVYATVINTKRTTISKLVVRTVLFDADDNAYAAGETIIPFLDKEGSQDISFTWDSPFENTPTKIRVYPIFDPFPTLR